jgi:hypothetical protein
MARYKIPFFVSSINIPQYGRLDADGGGWFNTNDPTLQSALIAAGAVSETEILADNTGGAGVSTMAALTDRTTYDLPANNTPLANALAAKADATATTAALASKADDADLNAYTPTASLAELIQDTASTMILNGTHVGCSFSYNDTTGVLTCTVTGSGGSSSNGIEDLAESNFGMCAPGSIGGTSVQAIGCSNPTLLDTCTASGTTAVSEGGAGGPYGYIRRQRYRAGASAINRAAAIWFNVMQVRSGVLKPRGRFPLVFVVGIGDASPTLGNLMVGVQGDNTPTEVTSVEPSAWASDNIFFGCDSADGNMFIMHNDNAGGATKIDLGATNFPRSQFVGYKFTIDTSDQGATFVCKAKNLNTGVEVTHTLSTNLPRNSVELYPLLSRCSMASVFQADLDFGILATGKWNAGSSSSGAGYGTAYVAQARAASITYDYNDGNGTHRRVPLLTALDTFDNLTNLPNGAEGSWIIQGSGANPSWAGKWHWGTITPPADFPSLLNTECYLIGWKFDHLANGGAGLYRITGYSKGTW